MLKTILISTFGNHLSSEFLCNNSVASCQPGGCIRIGGIFCWNRVCWHWSLMRFQSAEIDMAFTLYQESSWEFVLFIESTRWSVREMKAEAHDSLSRRRTQGNKSAFLWAIWVFLEIKSRISRHEISWKYTFQIWRKLIRGRLNT